MEPLNVAFRIHLLLTAFVFVATLFLTAVALDAQAEDRIVLPGISIQCEPGPCIAPSQVITAQQAWQMKLDPHDDTLLIDIRGRAEAYYTGLPAAIDAQVPFLEPAAGFEWNATLREPRLEFRTDFVAKVDRALRVAHLKHTDPVVLLCGSGDRAPVAALLLQEYGYSQVYVVRDGFEGSLERRADGSDPRTDGGWKNSGLPWTGRVFARGSSAQPRQY
jgi:rhodanese-related sulfurtransferase